MTIAIILVTVIIITITFLLYTSSDQIPERFRSPAADSTRDPPSGRRP